MTLFNINFTSNFIDLTTFNNEFNNDMDIYLIMIIALGLLAVGDLVVGVSNDAVNFLNSALGSKAISVRNIMILARAHGLESCPQQAWCEFGSTVHKVLDIPEDEIIISGMSVGYAAKAPENTLISERADVDEFAIFLE